MKHSLFLIFFIISTYHIAHGQDTKTDSLSYWKMKLACGLNLNQAAFSGNWKAGGVSSIGLHVQLNAQANYKKGRHNWNNELNVSFGFVYRENLGYQKTIDIIYLDSKYGYAFNEKWSVFTSLNFLTQFAKGYDTKDPKNLISELFAPAYFTSAWGIAYHPKDYFELRISPLAPRLTVVTGANRFVDFVAPKPYGVDPTKSVRFEGLAFQFFATFNRDLSKNINLQLRYILFANYETLSLDRIDHRIDLNFMAKIGKYINVSFGGILLYDYDQDKDVQFNQLFTLGLAYTIKNFEEKS